MITNHTSYVKTAKLSPDEKQHILQQVRKDISKRNKRKRVRLYLASTAAAACIAVLITVLYPSAPTNDIPDIDPLAAMQDSTSSSKDIQLVLADNQTITVADDADILYNKQEEIVVTTANEQIKATKDQSKEAALNKLIVPKGKRSSLTLADGSKVWINSGSTLLFPTAFTSDKREIWVEGEIYIEVTKDEQKPFHVNTSRLQVDVKGTRFNVTAYKEDAAQTVVLVEGSVNVQVENEQVPLLPNQLLSFANNKISTKNVNVYDYISWKDGVLQFNNEPLHTILTRLSRYYDIPIVCDEQVKGLICNGKLVLFDDVEEVIKSIYNTVPISYSMNENQIIIQKR